MKNIYYVPFVNCIFSIETIRQAVLVHLRAMNSGVQDVQLLSQGPKETIGQRKKQCLLISQLILDILHILQYEFVGV